MSKLLSINSDGIRNELANIDLNNSSLTALRTFTFPDKSGSLAINNTGEPNGFFDRTQLTYSWNNATRTLTLTPVSSNFEIWSDGNVFYKTEVSIQVSNVEGSHYIYFDASGNLQETTTFNSNIISKFCYVAALYWDATNAQVIINVINESHGMAMPSSVHSYLHTYFKTQYKSGLALTLTTGGNGSLDSHAQFSATSGEITDEDIPHTILAKALTDALPVVYLSGTNWRQQSRSFPMINTGTGRVAYNQNVAGNWQLTEVANNSFVLTHIFATPGLNISTGGFCAVIGQAQYSTLALAQAAAKTEASSIVTTGLPTTEFKLIATIIIKTVTNYTNTAKASFQATDTGASYIDWRGSTPSSNSAPSDHNALSNLQGGTAGEYYHLTAAEYTRLVPTINAQAGNYTAVLTDANNVTVDMTSASANTFTIPTNASVAFPVGSSLTVFRSGAGVTTIQATAGVTLNGTSGGSKTIDAQYQGVLLQKKATDTWYIFNK